MLPGFGTTDKVTSIPVPSRAQKAADRKRLLAVLAHRLSSSITTYAKKGSGRQELEVVSAEAAADSTVRAPSRRREILATLLCCNFRRSVDGRMGRETHHSALVRAFAIHRIRVSR